MKRDNIGLFSCLAISAFLIGALGGVITFVVAEKHIEALNFIVSLVSAIGTVTVSYIAIRKIAKKPELAFYLAPKKIDGVIHNYSLYLVNKGSSTIVSVCENYGAFYQNGYYQPLDDYELPEKLVVAREYESAFLFDFGSMIGKIALENEDFSNRSEKISALEGALVQQEVTVEDKTTKLKWALSIDWNHCSDAGVPALIEEPID